MKEGHILMCFIMSNNFLSDCSEFLDLNNIMAWWTMINFANSTLKLSAMGVVPLGEQYFLLCGGFEVHIEKR